MIFINFKIFKKKTFKSKQKPKGFPIRAFGNDIADNKLQITENKKRKQIKKRELECSLIFNS